MTNRPSATTLERTLRTIESRVLEEVWISRGRRAAGVALTLALVAAATVWWLDSQGGDATHLRGGVVSVAAAVFVLASAASGSALVLRRYRWCCAAAYCCGLAAVIGAGTFWWLRTGRAHIGPSSLVIADLAVATLTLGWLVVIVTPIQRSQPDMRKPHNR